MNRILHVTHLLDSNFLSKRISTSSIAIGNLGVASSPINNYDIVASRLNALISVIGPISDRRWLRSHPRSHPPLPLLFSPPPLPPPRRARLSGRLLCRKLRGTRSKRRRKSQFISFQAGRAAGDRDSDFPPRSRLPPHSQRGPALMTLENRSLRSLAHCHSSLSHAPLIARYLSLFMPF